MNIVFVTRTRTRGREWLKSRLEAYKTIYDTSEPHEWLLRSVENCFELQNGDTYRYCINVSESCGMSIDGLFIDDGVDWKTEQEFKMHVSDLQSDCDPERYCFNCRHHPSLGFRPPCSTCHKASKMATGAEGGYCEEIPEAQAVLPEVR